MQEFASQFNPKLILWGSDDLLAAYNRFRATGIDAPDEGSPVMLLAFERLLYAIRRDLGHPNKNLGPGDLLRVFVNDVDDYIGPSGEPRPEPRGGSAPSQ